MDKDNRLIIVGMYNSFKNEQDESARFIFGFMQRINEIDYDGSLARIIRYENTINEDETSVFIGVEVKNISSIPTGMIAWELTNDRWNIYSQEDGDIELASDYNINWSWIDNSLIDGEIRCIGDFYIENESGIVTQKDKYNVTANAYYDFSKPMENGDKVEIEEYDKNWSILYDEFAEWISSNIGTDIALRIEHIGSTAIPGMPAKPSIDVAVEVPSIEEGRRRIIPLLNDKTWEFWSLEDDMLFYKRDGFMGKRTHYLHIAPKNHVLWNRVAFRDYLRKNREDAERYSQLKKKLVVATGGEWVAYTNAKTDFVKEITSKALGNL